MTTPDPDGWTPAQRWETRYWAGHSSTENARHYAHTVTAQDQAAAAALQEAMG